MKKTKVTFFSDAGHGWLSVNRDLLKELNILNNVSNFSYQRGNRVYLEEDCDVSLLFDALKQKYGISKLDEVFDIKTSYKEVSPVRSYARFNPNKITKFSQGLMINLYNRPYIVESVKGRKVIVKNQDGFLFRLSGKAIDEAIPA